MSLISTALGMNQGDPRGRQSLPQSEAGNRGSGAARRVPDQAAAQPMDQTSIAALQRDIESKILPQLQDAFRRVMLAGQKLLFSASTHDMLLEEIQSSDPADKKLAGGAAGLMVLLNKESRGQIPPAIYIPAGAWLLLEIADVMVRGGQELTQQDVRDGLDQFAAAVMSHHGATPDQVTATMTGQPPTTQQSPPPQGALPSAGGAPPDEPPPGISPVHPAIPRGAFQ